MRSLTVGVYWLFAALALAAGVVALLMPGLALPAGGVNGLTAHLTRELASAFVFIGLMFVWCITHFDERRPIHLAMLVFIVLFAGVHWNDFLHGRGGVNSPLLNTIPAALLAVTAPFGRRA